MAKHRSEDNKVYSSTTYLRTMHFRGAIKSGITTDYRKSKCLRSQSMGAAVAWGTAEAALQQSIDS